MCKEEIDVTSMVEVFKSLIRFCEELRELFDVYENKTLDVCEYKTYESFERTKDARQADVNFKLTSTKVAKFAFLGETTSE